jgi:hypothetical protein
MVAYDAPSYRTRSLAQYAQGNQSKYVTYNNLVLRVKEIYRITVGTSDEMM